MSQASSVSMSLKKSSLPGSWVELDIVVVKVSGGV